LTGDPVWIRHEFGLSSGRRGGAQMYAVDLNGDGLSDVVSGHDAHGYGLSLFEQRQGAGGPITWRDHQSFHLKPPKRSAAFNFLKSMQSQSPIWTAMGASIS